MGGDRLHKIGLFGGTFDPIHTGHLIVGELIRDSLRLDRIIFIPAKKHPFKDNKLIADQTHRLKMIQLAIRDNSYLATSDIELRSEQVSYTVNTIQAIKQGYPADKVEIYFLMGMDNLNQLHLWREPGTLIKICKIVVFSRPGFEPAQGARKFLPHIQIIQIPLLEISSTQIRNRIKHGQTIRYLVPPAVESYILKNRLYTS